MSTSKRNRTLSCRQAVERTTEFLEGRLPVPSQAEFKRHLERCAHCFTYVQQIALVRGALDKLPGTEMPESSRKRLRKRLLARTSSAR